MLKVQEAEDTLRFWWKWCRKVRKILIPQGSIIGLCV